MTCRNSLVVGLLAAVFAGCAVPKQYTVHNMPAAGDHNVCLRVTLTEGREDAGRLCLDEFGLRSVVGCAHPDGRLIAPRPQSWNDWMSLVVLGHELVHTLGGTHE